MTSTGAGPATEELTLSLNEINCPEDLPQSRPLILLKRVRESYSMSALIAWNRTPTTGMARRVILLLPGGIVGPIILHPRQK